MAVSKGDWDTSRGRSSDLEFTFRWLKECHRILTENGSIWVSGTQHNIYDVGWVLRELGFKIVNDIVWVKPNAPPNLACRYFTHSHEILLWATKTEESRHVFNYDRMKQWDNRNDRINRTGRQMRSVWDIPVTPAREKRCGKHPTQKPLELLHRIITACSAVGDLICDPFLGSGTTAVAAKAQCRVFVGIDQHAEFAQLAKKRVLACQWASFRPPQQTRLPI